MPKRALNPTNSTPHRFASPSSFAWTTRLRNLDGGYQVNNEYNVDIPVNLPPGNHLVEIRNPGGDWLYLDCAREIRARRSLAPPSASIAGGAGGLSGKKSIMASLPCRPGGAPAPSNRDSADRDISSRPLH